MSLAAGKWIKLRPFADSSGQFKMVGINQCQSIQNNSNYWLESDESTWNIIWVVLQELVKWGRGIFRGITLEIFSFNQY